MHTTSKPASYSLLHHYSVIIRTMRLHEEQFCSLSAVQMAGFVSQRGRGTGLCDLVGTIPEMRGRKSVCVRAKQNWSDTQRKSQLEAEAGVCPHCPVQSSSPSIIWPVKTSHGRIGCCRKEAINISTKKIHRVKLRFSRFSMSDSTLIHMKDTFFSHFLHPDLFLEGNN